MVGPLQQKGDSGKLERDPPTIMVVLALELVLESHASDRGQVGGQSRSNAEKEFLVYKSPRRVACSQSNWLCAVRGSILPHRDSTETLTWLSPCCGACSLTDGGRRGVVSDGGMMKAIQIIFGVDGRESLLVNVGTRVSIFSRSDSRMSVLTVGRDEDRFSVENMSYERLELRGRGGRVAIPKQKGRHETTIATVTETLGRRYHFSKESIPTR